MSPLKSIPMKPSAFCVTVAFLFLMAGNNPGTAEGWEVVTLAGNGVAGYSGDGKPAKEAKINNPYGIVKGPDGCVYFCDMDNQVIRVIDKNGEIGTVVGTGRRGRATEGTLAREADLNEPYEVRFDPAGNLVFVEMKGAVVRMVEKNSGRLRTLAGTGTEGFGGDGDEGPRAGLRQPHSIQFDSSGCLLICDIGNHRIRKVAKDGKIQTISGTGEARETDQKALMAEAALNGPRAIDFDSKGNLWLALREGNAVYRSEGKMPKANWLLMAGTGEKGFAGNGGPAKAAQLSGPKGISVGPAGDVFLADTESHTIRVIRGATGVMDCVLGDGQRGNGEAEDPARCRLARPHGVFATTTGEVLVADSENHKIRLLRPRR